MPDVVPVVETEPVENPQEKVDVTPAPTVSEEEQLAAKIKADFETLYGGRLTQAEQSLRNQQEAFKRLTAERDELRQKVEAASRPVPVATTAPGDLWSTVQDGEKWKSEIDRRAEQKATEMLKAYQQQQAMEQTVQRFKQIRQECVAQVSSKYPDLHPETGTEESVVGQAYKRVVMAHPELLQDAYGPIAAMQLMEEELKSANGKVTPATARPSRTAQTSLPPSRPTTTGERLTMTREQKAFCDRNGIKYEDYLKTATALEQGSVEA